MRNQRYVEDFDLWCRLAAHGARIDFIEEPMAMRRGGGAPDSEACCLLHQSPQGI